MAGLNWIKQKSFEDIFEVYKNSIMETYKDEERVFLCFSGWEEGLIKHFIDNGTKRVDNDDYCFCLSLQGRSSDSLQGIVKLRNNIQLNKIIVFTNGSIQSMESLKDFVEIDYKSFLTKDILSALMKRVGFQQGQIDKTDKFIFALFDLLKPELSDLMKYLELVMEDYKENSDNLFLNFNINLWSLSLWSSSKDTELNKTYLKQIYAASNPIIIKRKINSPKDIDLINYSFPRNVLVRERFQSLKAMQKSLRELFYEKRTYADTFKVVCYEAVKNKLAGSSNRNKIKDNEQEEAVIKKENCINIYKLALEKMIVLEEGFIDVGDIENTEIEDDNGITTLYFNVKNGTKVNIEESTLDKEYLDGAEKNYNIFFQSQDESGKFEEIHSICQNIQLRKDSKKVLIELFSQYRIKRAEYLKNMKNPKDINECLTAANDYMECFFCFAKNIFQLDRDSKDIISHSGLLNKLVNIDAVYTDGKLLVPFYNPIILFHLNQMKYRYVFCLKIAAKDNNYIDKYKLEILNELDNMMKNEFLIWQDKLFMISSNNKYFPYYIEYNEIFNTSSVKLMNLNLVYNILLSYRNENAHKNEIKICLIGEIDTNSLKALLKKFPILVENANTRRMIIQLLSKSGNGINEIGDKLFEHKQDKYIEFLLSSLSDQEYNEINFIELLKTNDLIICLDSNHLYLSTQYIPHINSDINNILYYREFEREFESEENGKISIIPDVIDIFENAVSGNNMQHGIWNKYQMNTNFYLKVNQAMSFYEGSDKRIVILSSDSEIDYKIKPNRYLENIEDAAILGSKAKILVYSSKVDSNTNSLCYPENNNEFIILKAKNLYADLRVKWENKGYEEEDKNSRLYIMIKYNQFPEHLVIKICYEIKEDEDFTIEADKLIELIEHLEMKEFINKYIISSLSPKIFLDYYDREIVLKYIRKSTKTISDIVFASLLEKKKGINKICLCDDYEKITIDEEAELSSLDANTIFRLLLWLEEEDMSEKMIHEFNNFIIENNIDHNKLIKINDLVTYYQHLDLKHIINNFEHLRKGNI